MAMAHALSESLELRFCVLLLGGACRYEEYNIDEFPNGTNAIVAVIAYTG